MGREGKIKECEEKRGRSETNWHRGTLQWNGSKAGLRFRVLDLWRVLYL